MFGFFLVFGFLFSINRKQVKNFFYPINYSSFVIIYSYNQHHIQMICKKTIFIHQGSTPMMYVLNLAIKTLFKCHFFYQGTKNQTKPIRSPHHLSEKKQKFFLIHFSSRQ